MRRVPAEFVTRNGASLPTCAVVGVRSCQLDRNINVGKLVFDGLERGDRPPECVAIQGISLGHVEARLRAADLLERREDRGAIDQLADDGVTPRAFEAFSRRAVENETARRRRAATT